MDILVLLFVVILLVIDRNVRKRVIAALAAAVNLRHSVDTDSDTQDTRNDTRDRDSDTDDTRRDMHVTRDDTDHDTDVASNDTRDTRRDMHVTSDDTSNDMHDTTNDTDSDTHVTVSHDAIDAVARLVAADVISATRACQLAFGVSQRGNAAVYRAVRARVAELKKMSQMSQRDDIVDIRRDGRVIRCDSDGNYYVIHSNGKKEYIEEKEITV